jgi:hypothetical protein
VLRKKLRETPLHGGVSILRQEDAEAVAHLAQKRGGKRVDISLKTINAYETQLCEHRGDGSTAGVIVVKIEVERLLFCRKRHNPKNFVVKFLTTRRGREKSRGLPFCSRPRFFPIAHIQTSPFFGNAGGGGTSCASCFLIPFQRSKSFPIDGRGEYHTMRCMDDGFAKWIGMAGAEYEKDRSVRWALDLQRDGGASARG